MSQLNNVEQPAI